MFNINKKAISVFLVSLFLTLSRLHTLFMFHTSVLKIKEIMDSINMFYVVMKVYRQNGPMFPINQTFLRKVIFQSK